MKIQKKLSLNKIQVSRLTINQTQVIKGGFFNNEDDHTGGIDIGENISMDNNRVCEDI